MPDALGDDALLDVRLQRHVRSNRLMRFERGFLTNLPTYLRADPNLDDRSVEALEAIIGTAYEQFRTRD